MSEAHLESEIAAPSLPGASTNRHPTLERRLDQFTRIEAELGRRA